MKRCFFDRSCRKMQFFRRIMQVKARGRAETLRMGGSVPGAKGGIPVGMTQTQKILAKAANLETVQAGQLIQCNLSLVMGNDITAPVAINEFEKVGASRVFDKTKIALIPDHFTPNKDIKSAQQAKKMRDFAKKYEIQHYYEVGRAGIEHALLPELGLTAPGDVIIGADSHTCTYGALGAFSSGVGSTDMAAAMITGQAWFKVPPAIKVNLIGKLAPHVSGKDVILTLIGKIGVDGARYRSLEFTGEGVHELSMDSRFTIANMAVEAGAKNGIFPVDEKTIEYISGRVSRPYQVFEADPDAEYESEITLDLSRVELSVALPFLPENVRPARELADIQIDQAVIGSCTNGRMEDMRAAANIMKGKRVHPDVRCMVIPATQNIYRACIEEGLTQIFLDAGAMVAMPTCGPCLGGHCGVLAAGEKCVSTTNRNFVGRMGHATSEVYLSGPAVAAASAIAGHIALPGDDETAHPGR